MKFCLIEDACCFVVIFCFASRRRHTRCALVTGVQTFALPIYLFAGLTAEQADLAYVLMVSGRAGHERRPVAVLRSSGAVWIDDQPMQVAGIIYVDEATEIGSASGRE